MADIDELSASQIAQGVKDGSFSATPVPRIYTSTIEVPRSIPISVPAIYFTLSNFPFQLNL